MDSGLITLLRSSSVVSAATTFIDVIKIICFLGAEGFSVVSSNLVLHRNLGKSIVELFFVHLSISSPGVGGPKRRMQPWRVARRELVGESLPEVIKNSD